MGKFKVSTEKEQQLLSRMDSLGIKEEDIEESFIRGSGSGGQKINKTSSCVHLIHKPSNTEVKCQLSRSQALNRFHARRELCDQIEEQVLGERSKKQQEIEKIKRQKRKRSKRAKQKMLDDKRIRGGIKETRGKVKDE